jgi:hypothetical protein
MAENKILVEFERHVALGSTTACRLIGMAYPTYAAYRSGLRKLPLYHKNHIEDIRRLPRRLLKELINERIYD